MTWNAVSEPEPQGPKYAAFAGLAAGIVGLCAWAFPICGWPVALAALGGGLYGLKSRNRAAAVAALVLGGLVFLASTFNFLWGLVLALQSSP